MEAATLPGANAPQQPSIYEFGSDKVQTITLDQYSQSGRIEGKYGKVFETKPIQIWNLVTMILGLATENEVNAALKSIHVARRDAHATLSDSDRDAGYSQTVAPINRWTFEKVIAMIDIPNIGSNLANARLGITLNKMGLAIAFGMNVHACSNFNVMGGTVLRAYTRGTEKGLPWEIIKHRLGEWMGGLNQLWTIQQEWMDTMTDTQIGNPEIIEEIFGDLYLRAIHNAYTKQTQGAHSYGHGTAPFDTNELSKFAQESLKSRTDQIGTVWDLYNWGTSIMKPGTADIGEIVNNSNDWADYLANKFELGLTSYEVVEDD